MAGILGGLIGVKQLERFALQQLQHMSRKKIVELADHVIDRISDDQMPETAKQLRALADAFDAKDRTRAAELIADDLEEFRL